MPTHQFAVATVLGFANGVISLPPRLATSPEFMKAIHIFAFRVGASTRKAADIERLLVYPKLGPQEQAIKDAWEAVCVCPDL